jgi:chloride channel protein, CIC family
VGEEFKRLNQERWALFPKAATLGIASGLLAAAFRSCLEHSDSLFARFVSLCHGFGLPGIALVAALACTTIAIAVLLVRWFAPEAAGSGIPHVKLVLLGRREFRDVRVLLVKFASGVIGIGGGLALGREGPTVQMGAAIGRRINHWWRSPTRDERDALLICGAAAGLSAAFNAPLAGVIFALEEMQVRFSQSVFFAAAVASLLADIVVRSLLGELPAFRITISEAPGIWQLPHCLLIGLLAGALGLLFNWGIVTTTRANRAYPVKWGIIAGVFVVATTVVAAWFDPAIVGGGLRLTDWMLTERHTLGVLGTILVVRFVLSVSSYGLGSSGGIFAPMLLVGGLLGMALGNIFALIGIPRSPDPVVAAFVGMAAFFSSVVRCPLTGIVLLVEMSGYYPMVLVLLAGAFAAVGVADFFHQEPVYEALMRRDIESDDVDENDSVAERHESPKSHVVAIR